MRLFIPPPFQCCTNAICSKSYHVFFSLLVFLSVSSDDSSIAFLWRLLHRTHQISQLANSSLHQSTILFPCFNCHSITPNNILRVLRRSHKKKISHILFIPEITQITVLIALGKDPTSSSYWA